jgi:hypothetical protein
MLTPLYTAANIWVLCSHKSLFPLRFEVLMVMKMLTVVFVVFWAVMLCNLVHDYCYVCFLNGCFMLTMNDWLMAARHLSYVHALKSSFKALLKHMTHWQTCQVDKEIILCMAQFINGLCWHDSWEAGQPADLQLHQQTSLNIYALVFKHVVWYQFIMIIGTSKIRSVQ